MSVTLTVVSAGDVLQLCQQTWKLQHTFKSDRDGTPKEFSDIGAELEALTKALNAISEILDEDQSLLLASNFATKRAAILILESCQRTLHELEIFVASYQDVKKVTRPDGSRIIERKWRPIFIRNFSSTIWTHEGGNIHDLKIILGLHTQSMIFFYEAIRSQDQKLLEFVLPPVAQDVRQIHVPCHGTEKAKLDEIQGDLDGLTRKFRTISASSPQRIDPAFDIGSPQFHYGANTSRPRADASREWLSDTRPDEPPLIPPRSPSREARNVSNGIDPVRPSLSRANSSAMQPVSPIGTSPPLSPRSFVPGSLRKRSNTNDSYVQPPPYEQRTLSPAIDSISHNLDRIELASDRSRSARVSTSTNSFNVSAFPTVVTAPLSPTAEDPFHQLRMLGRATTGDSSSGETSDTNHHKLWRATLFKNSATLFDKKCLTVEYTKPNEKRQGDFVMETASGPCQLYLITKGNRLNTGAMAYNTSIWVLSDDGEVVMEQELPEDNEIIPYTIWDNQTKIVLRVPASLRFYSKYPKDQVKETAHTTWVNYIFADEPAATEFQDVLLGKKLLASIRTRKTTRLHTGIAGAFANQQQLCALENLRIFQDHNSGLVYAMIHFVPEFSTGNGYMTFPLNDTKHPIRVKEDGSAAIKIKGMTMSIREGTRRASTSSDPVRATKKGQDVLITGARLEFYSESDKTKFMMKLKDIQDAGVMAYS